MALVEDKLKCGECGCETFTLTHRVGMDLQRSREPRWGGEGSGGIEGTLVVSCTQCKRTTKIQPVAPRLSSDGPLCGGWFESASIVGD